MILYVKSDEPLIWSWSLGDDPDAGACVLRGGGRFPAVPVEFHVNFEIELFQRAIKEAFIFFLNVVFMLS